MKFWKRATIGIAAAAVICYTDKPVCGQPKPDLVVSSVAITRDPSGLFVENVSVTVRNICLGSTAPAFFVLLTFKENDGKDAKSLYYVGKTIGPLNGGRNRTQNFDTKGLRIGAENYLFIDADPYKKIAEVNEDNNWRTLNPEAAPISQTQCK